jgi:predicted PurR-regulated permease PerM
MTEPNRDRLLTIVLAILTGLVFVACLFVLAPFVPALTWALALSVIGFPIHRWIAKRVHKPDLAAGLSVAVITVGLLGPTLFIGYQVAKQVSANISEVQAEAQNRSWSKLLESHPKIGAAVDWVETRLDLDDQARKIADALQQWARNTLTSTAWSIAQVLISLFCLFFFLRDHHIVMRGFRSMSPLSDQESDKVFRDVRDIVHATIYGNVVTALIQGGLGGTMFWLLGIPTALLWAVVMALLSLVPSLGAFVIWLPAAAILGIQGHWAKAAILAGWGVFVVGTIDNIVYPILVGKEMRMHTLNVFLATVGGLMAFGAPGIVIGPVVFALAFSLVRVWRTRTTRMRSAENTTAIL